MTNLINASSFIATGVAKYDENTDTGTVEVTLRGETKRVSASRDNTYGRIFAYDMIGRYQTGGKAWPASVNQNKEGVEHVNFGRDDRSAKFNKVNQIWFAPEAK